MIYRILLTLLFIVLISESKSQISVREYRKAVIDNSRELGMARANSRQALEQQNIAYTALLPALSLSGNATFNLHQNSGVKPWGFSLQPQILAPLYHGGTLRGEHRAARMESEAASATEQFSLSEVIYAADYAYWNLSAMELHYSTMTRYVEIIESLKEVIVERFDEGYISKNDVLAIESRLSEANYQLLLTKQRLEEARHNFNILRGKESDSHIELGESVLDSVAMPQRESLEQAIERRADLRSAQLLSEVAKIGINLSRGDFLPQIDAGVGGVWQPESPNINGKSRVTGQLFLRLSTPIFHWGERRHSEARAKAAAESKAWQVLKLEEDIVREESNGWSMLIESYAQKESAEQNLKIATENLELSTYSYNEGLTTILDVLQAQLSWFQIYTNAIAAHLSYAVARAQYRHIIGKLPAED